MNDLGGSSDGTGQSSSDANALVKQIEQSGGKAIPDYRKKCDFVFNKLTQRLFVFLLDSVEEGDQIVKTAISQFGKIGLSSV